MNKLRVAIGIAPPLPIPVTSMPGVPNGSIRIAQGQELLGPCQECRGHWTREVTPGRKPQTCPVCKRDG